MVSASIQQHHQAADKFGDMLEAYTDGMIVVNEKAEILLINTQAERLFGYTDLELFGKTVETVIPAYFFIEQAGRRTHYAKLPKTTPSRKGMEPFGVKKDGTKIPIDISLSPVVTVEGTLIFAAVIDITDRKNEAKKLQRSQQDFQLLVNSVKEYAIFMLDTDGNVVTWNSGAEHIKGYSADEITGRNIEVFYTPEDIQKGLPKSNLAIAMKEGHFESEGFRVRKDGSVFYAKVVFTPLYDDNNKLYGYAKVTRDITEKQNAEESLRYMATIADSIQDPIISSDNNSFITRWNDAAEKLLEWKSEEVSGKNIDSVLSVYYPNETKSEILICLQQKGRWQGELVYLTKTHKRISVLVTESQLKDSNAVVTGSIVVAKDITERKKTEGALAKFNRELELRVNERTESIYKNEVLFRSMIEHSNDVFLRVDEKFAVLFCSPSAERVVGWTVEEMSQEVLPTKAHPDDRPLLENKLCESIANPEKMLRLLFRHRHKNGKYSWLEGSVINFIPNKYIQSVVLCLHDVTEFEETAERLSGASQRLAAEQEWEDHSSA